MEPSSHFVIPLIFAFLVLSAFPIVAHKQVGEGLEFYNTGAISNSLATTLTQTSDKAGRLYANVIIKVSFPPPSGCDDAWANSVLQANDALLEVYPNLIEQLTHISTRSTGVKNPLVVSEIKQATADNVELFRSAIAQLVESILVKSKTGAIDSAQASAVLKTVEENNKAFTYTFARLAELSSKTGGTDYPSVVIHAAYAYTGAFTDLIKNLLYLPITSTGHDDALTYDRTQAIRVLLGAFRNLIKLTSNPPPGIDSTSASAILQANYICLGAFTNVMKMMARLQQQPLGINNAGTIRKETIFADDCYPKVIEQLLLFQQSMAKNHNADKSRDNAIKKTSEQAAATFANMLEELTVLFTKGSQKDAADKAWTNAIIETADTEVIAFTNLVDLLSNMPHPSTETYNAKASEVLRRANVVVGVFAILIDELLLSQSTGLAKAYPADPSALLAAIDKYAEVFTNLVKLNVEDHKRVSEF